MKRKRLAMLSTALALALILTLVIGCDEEVTESGELEGVVTVLHAGSLAVPFSEMEDEFEEMYPGVDVQCESASSGVTIRKVTELGLNAEVVASADYYLIPELMYPDYADWYVAFAKNRMVLCYTDKSLYDDEITSDNWYEILLRDGVEYAHSDLLDPCGYRTLLVWQLAEEYYNQPGLYEELVANCPEKNIRPKSVELVALLESGDIDYAYEYISVAMQHNLQYVEFPPEIDLSDIAFEDFYAQSTVDVPGSEPGTTIAVTGTPIVYGVTIPTNTENPDLAIAFMKYLLGDKGQAIMNRNGQPAIAPALADDLSKLPAELQPYAVQAQ